MGRQIQLHLLANDVNRLIEHISSKCDLKVILRDSDRDNLDAVKDPSSEKGIMTLWNQTILGDLKRKTIVRNDGRPWYLVDGSLPTLEFSTSVETTWNGKPGLVQGRIYGQAMSSNSDFNRWYQSIVRWIGKEFHKNPVSLGYIGQEAWNWFQSGGILLPTFSPPVNSVWIGEIAKQQIYRRQTVRA
jgi:hypothetical protein